MTWTVLFAPEFEKEFDQFSVVVQDELLAQASVVERFGPNAGRPRVDTLKGSKFPNMKELRFDTMMEYGALRLPLTHNVRRSYWSAAISQAEAKNAFTSD